MRKNCSSWSFQICGTVSMLIAFMSCSLIGCCFEDCFAMTWVAPAQWPGYTEFRDRMRLRRGRSSTRWDAWLRATARRSRARRLRPRRARRSRPRSDRLRGVGSHRQCNAALGCALYQVADRARRVDERVGPPNNGVRLAGLNELEDLQQILVVLP